jgi:hypothetical protein
MSNPSINLDQFCAAPNDPRTHLNTPLSIDNYTYASNGHLIIRIDRRHDTPAPDNLPKKVADLFRSLPEQALQKCGTEIGTLRLADFEPELTDCNECEGTGLTHVCPECQGDGEVFLQSDFYDYEAECKSCEGSGTISDNQIESLRSRNSRHPGVNKAPNRCQSCAGSGKQPNEEKHIVGDTTLGTGYLLLLKTLPNSTVFAFGKNDFALIVFDGGIGILMPRRD